MRRAFPGLLLAAAALAGTVSYTYDDAGRLAKVDYGDGRSISYTYDNGGNLLRREVTAPAQPSEARPPGEDKTAEPRKQAPSKTRKSAAGAKK